MLLCFFFSKIVPQGKKKKEEKSGSVNKHVVNKKTGSSCSAFFPAVVPNPAFVQMKLSFNMNQKTPNNAL